MAFDGHKNFAISTVATAPSPATSGTSLVVASGDGANFPAASFNAVVYPATADPSVLNAEIVRVTGKSTDTFTITRTQESTSARSIQVGDRIGAFITAKTITDIETATPTSGAEARAKITAGNYTTTSTTFGDVDSTNAKLTITTGAKPVLIVVTAFGHMSATNQDMALDIDIDGTREGGSFGLTGASLGNTSADCNCSFSYVTDALSAGSHTFKLKWLVTGGTGTLYASATAPLTIAVKELT